MVKFGSLKNVEVKRIKIRDWVWFTMVGVGSTAGIVLADWYAQTH